MRRFSFFASSFALCFGLGTGPAGCTADDSGTTETTIASSTATDSTSTSEGTSTSEATTEDTSTTAAETDPTTTDPTTTTTTTTTTDPTTTTTDATTTTDGAVCGDGEISGNEACDDGNTKTEFPSDEKVPHGYGDADCLDVCDLLAPTCGDGVVDLGEDCDDGNTDSHDGCTTSCTVNEGGFDAPCTRDCGGDECDANDVLDGEIVGCGNVTAPAGTKKVCYESGHIKLLNIIDRKIYFGEGSCMVTAQKCEGAFCPGFVTFGDYDGFSDCPAGTAMADRVTDEGGVKVSTKVCHKTCESDSDCRWNAHDEFWTKPGQYRCQATPDSAGVKICADAQNF